MNLKELFTKRKKRSNTIRFENSLYAEYLIKAYGEEYAEMVFKHRIKYQTKGIGK